MAGDIANVVESESKQERLQSIELENLKKKKSDYPEDQSNKKLRPVIYYKLPVVIKQMFMDH